MIFVNNCTLYNMKSKKYLMYLLDMDKSMLKQSFVISQVSPYLQNKNGKKRLIEVPSSELKKSQSRLKHYMSQITVPSNIFSGIKNRSYIGNAAFHINCKYLYKIDLKGFFPSISRNTVYSFFKNDLCCSPDVASILTNITTIDLDRIIYDSKDEINQFLLEKKIDVRNHLISGSPASQILSYLVNHKMFESLQNLCNANNIIMTVYVDDITFSSQSPILQGFRNKVNCIIYKNGYKLSKSKVKLYKSREVKLVTGVIITPNNNLVIKNSIRRNLIHEFHNYKKTWNHNSKLRLCGLLNCARQVNKTAYPSVYLFLKK